MQIAPPFWPGTLRAGGGQGLAGKRCPRRGQSCGGSACPAGYKGGGGGGGGCSRHRTGAPGAVWPWGTGECGHGMVAGEQGERGPLFWGSWLLVPGCPLFTHPQVSPTPGCWRRARWSPQERDRGVPAHSQRWEVQSSPFQLSFGSGWALQVSSISLLVSPSSATPRGGAGTLSGTIPCTPHSALEV